ncbi:hypothetical protein ABIE27_000428 [Paenibacillus sp. 4624]|jgi:hypothetical protein
MSSDEGFFYLNDAIVQIRSGTTKEDDTSQHLKATKKALSMDQIHPVGRAIIGIMLLQ